MNHCCLASIKWKACCHLSSHVNNWEAKDQWRTTVDFDLPGMLNYNFKSNKCIRHLLDPRLMIFYMWTPGSTFIVFASPIVGWQSPLRAAHTHHIIVSNIVFGHPLHLLWAFVHPSQNIDCHCWMLLRFITFFSLQAARKRRWILAQKLFPIVKKWTTSHLAIGEWSSFQFIVTQNECWTCIKLIEFNQNLLYEPVWLSWEHVQNFVAPVLPECKKTRVP